MSSSELIAQQFIEGGVIPAVLNANAPGSHAMKHITGGSDIIPNAVSGGNSGLMSGSDAQSLRVTLPTQLTNVQTTAAGKADIAYVNTQIASVVSGSPKGVYATLAALTAAIPAGNTNIYVVTANGNWYYWNGSAWTAGGVYQTTGITAGSITPDKLSFSALKGLPSKNLFNKDTVTAGYYVYFSTGGLLANAGYSASDYIPVIPSTTYTKNKNQQYAYYGSDKSYVTTPDNTNILTFTTPSNVYYVRLTVANADLNSMQFELGSVSTAFTRFDPILDINSLQLQNLLIVSKNGGNFSTITAAVTAAQDSAINPVTILVMPGTYIENVNIIGRYISIVGVNKETCIIRDDTGNYSTPPVNMSGGGNYLANLTILSTHDISTTYLNSYAVHCDASGIGTSELFNCILISKQHAAIGIGLHDQQRLILNNCELYKNSVGVTTIDGGAIYMHNQQANGATNQKFIVKNCTITTDLGKALVVEDANHRSGGGYGDARDTTITFYNNMLFSKELKKVGIIGGDSSLGAGYAFGYITLTEDSYGNNLSALNV